MLREPNVEVLAERLRACLDQAQAHDSSVAHVKASSLGLKSCPG